jgi:hypothetical protein
MEPGMPENQSFHFAVNYVASMLATLRDQMSLAIERVCNVQYIQQKPFSAARGRRLRAF